MKVFILLLTSFILPLSFASRGNAFYLDKINETYESYTINVDENYDEYKLSIVTGIVNDEKSYGVYFEADENSNLMLVCKMGDEIYQYAESSDGSIWILGIKYSEETTILLYNSQLKQSDVKLVVTEELFNDEFDYLGLNQGCTFSEVESMNDKFTTQIVLYIVCGVVVTICIILLLVFKVTHSGLFSKTARANSSFNMKDFIQNTPEELDPFDPVKDVEIIEYEKDEESGHEVIEIPQKTAKELLIDKGYIVDYTVLSEEEKDKVMLELMLLKENGDITLEEYKKETVELWKK